MQDMEKWQFMESVWMDENNFLKWFERELYPEVNYNLLKTSSVTLVFDKVLWDELLFTHTPHCLQPFGQVTAWLSHCTLLLCQISHLYLLQFLRYWDSN